MKIASLASLALLASCLVAPLVAQSDPEPSDANLESAAQEQAQAEAEAQWSNFLNSLGWKTDGAGELSQWSTISIPEGYRYLEGQDAAKLMEAYGNPPSSYDGLIAVDNLDWLVLFEFENSGYVKDDEKDELNADKLLATIKKQQDQGNEYRRNQGLEELFIDGWAVEPKYNETTNNLEWGLLLRTPTSGQFVNYHTKLLGREGLMNVTLICDLAQLQEVLPTYQTLLLGHQYNPGKSYAEYKQGDRVAEYGLTALIAGGALFGAAKLGLLATIMAFFKKFVKLIIIGVVAIGVAIKKFFAKMAGRHVREDNTGS